MNTQRKQNSSLITTFIVLITIMISVPKTQASTELDKISEVVNHKINIEKQGVGVAVVLIDKDEISYLNFGVTRAC